MVQSLTEKLTLWSRKIRGGGALRRAIRDANLSTLVHFTTPHGLTLALDPFNYIDAIILRDGYYEPEILDAIISNLPPGGALWDVGANIGVHSITAQHLRPDITAIAFEPSPVAASRLLLNATINRSNVKLLSIALGASAGYLPLSLALRGNTGLSSLSPWPGIRYDASILTRVEAGDGIVGSICPAPAVIKIDVEGHECEVLSGLNARVLTAPELKAVIFESKPERLPEATACLARHGFRTSPVASPDPDAPCNYIAIRGSPEGL